MSDWTDPGAQHPASFSCGELGTATDAEPNDSAATAQAIDPCTTVDGTDSNSTNSGDYDFFSVIVPETASSLTLRLTDIGTGTASGSSLAVYKPTVDGPGDEIESLGATASGTTTKTLGVTAGEYVVRVLAANGRSYTLDVILGNTPNELEESNDLRVNAQEIIPGIAYEGQDSNPYNAGETDWYTVEVPAGATRMTVALTDIGTGTTSGTTFYTYLAESDEYIETEGASAMATNALSHGVREGRYDVRVDVGNSRRYLLTVTLEATPYELEESNDLRVNGQQIFSGVQYRGHDSNPYNAGESDWFSITVPPCAARMTLTLADEGAGTASGTALYLFNQDGTAHFEETRASISDTRALTVGVKEGQYDVHVDVANGRSYVLSVEFDTSGYELEESNDIRATAQSLALGTTYEGHDANIYNSGETDWFRLTVPEGRDTVTVELAHTGKETSAALSFSMVDAQGTEVATDSPAPASSTSTVIGVTPGEYAIAVNVGNARTYSLTVR